MMRKKRRPSVEKSESAAPPDVSKQMVFQKRLQQRLNKSPRYPGIVQEFIKGLESHIEDPERFRDCLLPVYHAWPMGPADRSGRDKELAGKLMQLVSMAPVEIQRDIINSLPEILEDSQHSDIASELNSLLQENTQLTMPSLD
ncbi:Fanconi anemia group D2 protein homolog [Salvelinus namaycush]|uniref:Fanconi anemia group D2 protein homolog n=1 Tax=Salvelinus namaycush TaxID=8040 RepID=A0A8U1H7F9_SALNM|nr:Fanconi anemia group D2 protein homolog [Salvelinus namaycush]